MLVEVRGGNKAKSERASELSLVLLVSSVHPSRFPVHPSSPSSSCVELLLDASTRRGKRGEISKGKKGDTVRKRERRRRCDVIEHDYSQQRPLRMSPAREFRLSEEG